MYGNGMIGNASMMGPFMWIFMILLWVLAIVGVIYLVKGFMSRTRTDPGTQESALDILKARYARGEISDDEFEEMKQKLVLK